MSDSSPAPRRLLHPVAPDVDVLDPGVGPDTMAVFGAMASRAPDLAAKIDQTIARILAEEGLTEWSFENPPKRIREFLSSNVAGYGHASIAAMAQGVCTLVKGFGWPAAWLLLDYMSFDGQELSTRAVDALKVPGTAGPGTPCRYAPAGLESLHTQWLALYAAAKERPSTIPDPGQWKYDDARLFLPGTVPTGVVVVDDARSFAKHLDHMTALGGVGAAVAEQAYQGLEYAAPLTTASIGHRTRKAHAHWGIETAKLVNLTPTTPPDFLTVCRLWDDTSEGRWRDVAMAAEPRPKASTHLDPTWRIAPRFSFNTVCTVATARDWHRHRMVMPWNLAVCEQDGAIAMAPWSKLNEYASPELLAETNATYQALKAGGDAWAALHALPFGALVMVSCVGTLPDLLYMLELRATAPGANFEYRAQARAGIAQLCRQVPQWIVERESLDGVIRTDTTDMPI